MKCRIIWHMMMTVLHSDGQRSMETQRKNVKNLLYGSSLLTH